MTIIKTSVTLIDKWKKPRLTGRPCLEPYGMIVSPTELTRMLLPAANITKKTANIVIFSDVGIPTPL
jgi:hypothetical protein